MKTISKIAEELKKGKVIVCPTDTVYGLIADATNKKAVDKVFKIKRRKKTNPLPIFVYNLEAAKKLAIIDKNQESFLKSAWPGKITAVLKRRKGQKLYGVDEETIALRIPNHKFVLNLIKCIRKPLTGTSANVSGKSPTTKIDEVLKQLKNKPDLIIDAGDLKSAKPSTIIDLTDSKPRILRK